MRRFSKIFISVGTLFGAVVSGSTAFAGDFFGVGMADRRQSRHRLHDINNRRSSLDLSPSNGDYSLVFSDDDSVNQKNYNAGKEKIVHRVCSGADLAYVLSNGERCRSDGSLRVELLNNITLSSDLNLPSGTILNLNGYTIEVTQDAVITSGTKKVVKESPYTVWAEVDRCENTYSYDSEGRRVTSTRRYKERVPRGTRHNYVFSYDDRAVVKVINGRIVGQKCKKIEAAKDAYWYSEAHGKVGYDKGSYRAEKVARGKVGDEKIFYIEDRRDVVGDENAIINVLSGNLVVSNLYISGHEGGDGGDATYSALWHIPFGGGDGGNGGKGGKGSNVFNVEVGHGKVLNKGGCIFEPGRGGAGGKGSGPNPSYWLWSGSSGKDGQGGEAGEIINDAGSLMR